MLQLLCWAWEDPPGRLALENSAEWKSQTMACRWMSARWLRLMLCEIKNLCSLEDGEGRINVHTHLCKLWNCAYPHGKGISFKRGTGRNRIYYLFDKQYHSLTMGKLILIPLVSWYPLWGEIWWDLSILSIYVLYSTVPVCSSIRYMHFVNRPKCTYANLVIAVLF